MKKIKGLLLAATLMLTASSLMAQTYSELGLTFSQTKPAGSARILGMGGASVSLGGDFSSAYSNPAGLGMYNRSEFTITPGYMSLNNNGSYMSGGTNLSNSNSDTRTALNIPGISLVLSKPQDGDGGFIHGSFAVTMTRTNDFNSNIRYSGTNPNTSLIDYSLYWATGNQPEALDKYSDATAGVYNSVEGLSYRNFLIESEAINDGDPTQYFSYIGGIPTQSETIQTKGGQSQWNLSYGANFNDKFFLGAGLGIVSLNFQSHKVYSESFSDDGPLNSFALTEDLSVKGTGINLTVGGILRPVDGFQLGASIATPTRYSITDSYTASMTSSWKNIDYYGDGSLILGNESSGMDVVTSSYNLLTPWKFSAGASYIFGKHGLISVDVEHLNYGGAKYNSQTANVSFDEDNKDMKAEYASVTNVRAGGEYRIKSFRLRGGFNYMPNPYKTVQNDVSNARMAASLGVGYRASTFFIDLAYINSWSEKSYRPYTLYNNLPSPLLTYDQKASNVVATIGFIF